MQLLVDEASACLEQGYRMFFLSPLSCYFVIGILFYLLRSSCSFLFPFVDAWTESWIWIQNMSSRILQQKIVSFEIFGCRLID